MHRSLARALARAPSGPCRLYSTLPHPRLPACTTSVQTIFGLHCAHLVRHRPSFAPLAVNVLQVRFSGHNKWSKIRHTKGAKDAKKGQIFAKLCLEIISAIRAGGTDTTVNLRLAAALNRARLAKMPKENIEGAFSKATKSKDTVEMEDQTYEGYGPGGVAMIIETITDKKNRTSKCVREILTRYGGSFSSVLWMFEKKGKLRFHPSPTSPRTPDQMIEDAIEAGAEDVEELVDGDAEGLGSIEITCDYTELARISRHLTAAPLGYEVTSLEIAYVPTTTMEVKGKEAEETLEKCIMQMEELEDVVKVYMNAVEVMVD